MGPCTHRAQAGAQAVVSLWLAVQGKPSQGSFRQPGVHLKPALAAHTPAGQKPESRVMATDLPAAAFRVPGARFGVDRQVTLVTLGFAHQVGFKINIVYIFIM